VCRAATADAPRLVDLLCEPCASHFARVRAGLDSLGVPYTLQPRLVDLLCEPCATHFARVRAGLVSLGVAYTLQPRLVRGLDYYTRTTFELAADALDSAQNAVGGGGRYDKLAEALGGPPTPGIGFGMGIERLMLACDAEGVFPAPASAVDVWVVDTTGGAHALLLTHELRAAGVSADRGFDGRSMKSQFKSADRSGARLAVVVGDNEVAAATVTLRDLRAGDQETVDRADVVERVRKLLQ
jgi:histidyl-tRNA synthetase